jgi:hypothetical protein
MTTPILPTKSQLAAYTYSPAQLIADAVVEQFLSVTNNYDFILKLIQAFRGGLAQSYNINGVTVISSVTSFIYIGASTDVNYLNTVLGPAYGYTVTTAVYTPGVTSPAVIPATVTMDGTGTPFAITLGPNAGKSCILVAWG